MLNKTIIKDREVYKYIEDSDNLLIYIGEEEVDFYNELIYKIKEKTNKNISIYFINIKNWNYDLSPWKMKAIFGKEDFGDGGKATLDFIINDLLNDNDKKKRIILGGYSLAGLFSLWSGYECDLFESIMSASSSLWFDGWKDYIDNKIIKVNKVYLSLGLKENKSKNKILSTIKDITEYQYQLLKRQLNNNCILEFNEGNHFQDVLERCVKGYSYLLN